MSDAGRGNRWKKIGYQYDLISGKVNTVSYQPGQPDAFYHRYSYDAENRITNVETSKDSIYWENDAFYQYYKHGPLARAVIGQQQVQALDYAYTLQGWLKGVNSTAVTPAFDMGHDGAAGSIVAKDAFGFALHYYGNGEYSPVNNTVTPFAAVTGLTALFNGNISAISQNLPSLGNPLLYSYNYDVLNRLKKMQASNGLNTTTNTWTPIALPDYKESISYDANGNILTYDRYGNKAVPNKQMDSLTYSYQTGTNKLDFIKDDIAAANYDNDIDNQSAGNYGYDAIGNLVKDSAGSIRNISWNVYGKIATITKTDGSTINYTYDVAGNRVSKTVNDVQTWYVRDATGNVMSVYAKGDNSVNSGALSEIETHLYGTSRLGINTLNINMESGVTPVTIYLTGLGSGFNINFIRGKKFFELSNHLGNVLATVSDKKTSIFTGSVFDHYEADIISSEEYYPFGMQMPGRGFSSSKYRYGFNGQEKSEEIDGVGNSYTAQFWEYDSRIGRRWNLDPEPISGISEYATFNGNPILYSDILGNYAKGPGPKDYLKGAWSLLTDYYHDKVAKAPYAINQFDITLKSGEQFRADSKRNLGYLGGSLFGAMDGLTRAGSMGIVHRSAESLGLSAEQAEWYNAASDIWVNAGMIEGVSGGTSPRLALAGEAQVAARTKGISLRINHIVLSSDGSSNDEGLTVEYEGEQVPIYRGGYNLKLQEGEFELKTPAAKYRMRGISLDTDPDNLLKRGGAFRVISIPEELKLIHTPSTNTPGHFDPILKEIPTGKSKEEVEKYYQKLLFKIQLDPTPFHLK